MAREYVRPDLSKELLAELVPANTRVLLNPTWADLAGALAELQSRTWKNCLFAEELRQLYESSVQPAFFSTAASSADLAPPHYRYDYPSTQAVACRLGDGLTGFLLTRTHTPPGNAIPPLLYPGQPSDTDFDPQAWLNSVCIAFWTRLTDDEINAIERKAIEYAMVITVRRREEALRRAQRIQTLRPERVDGAERHVQAQLESLFMGVHPAYTTHLSQACQGIADILSHEEREAVPWREFKQRWASVAERYRNDLLPVVNGGRVAVKSLREMQGQRLFSLSFGLWTGSQRIFQAPQLVFRVEARDLLSGLAMSNHNFHDIVEIIKQLNRATMRFHPTLEWTVGWLRVHVDDENRLVFVDEIQSDTCSGSVITGPYFTDNRVTPARPPRR